MVFSLTSRRVLWGERLQSRLSGTKHDYWKGQLNLIFGFLYDGYYKTHLVGGIWNFNLVMSKYSRKGSLLVSWKYDPDSLKCDRVFHNCEPGSQNMWPIFPKMCPNFPKFHILRTRWVLKYAVGPFNLALQQQCMYETMLVALALAKPMLRWPIKPKF